MRLKYMGIADARLFPKGDTFNGRLPEGLPVAVLFDNDNAHVVDTNELGLDEDAVSLLLTEPDIKDVTELKRIPAGLNEKTFRGVSDEARAAAAASDDDESEGAPTSSGVNDEGTTTGGSTSGRARGGATKATGASTSSGGTTTTVGGST